ncbi:reverse transcriptase domain-containing protein [Tanacetum coccineum]
MDEGGRRSLLKNERMLRFITNNGSLTDKGFETLTCIIATSKDRRDAKTPLTENRVAKKEEVKRKEPEPENAWKLFTDGASSADVLGAGLMVVSPERMEYTYTLRFEFETTNNEAEYEALLAGLRIAKELEIRELIIFVDSQLVANQVKGLFEARQQTIK